MCDYSLHGVATRPAKVGDQLVTTQFWNTTTRGFSAAEEPRVAVCLLPGTEVAFENKVERHLTGFPLLFRRTRPLPHLVARFRQVNWTTSAPTMMRWSFPTARSCCSRIFAKASARPYCSSRRKPRKRKPNIQSCRKRDVPLTGFTTRRPVDPLPWQDEPTAGAAGSHGGGMHRRMLAERILRFDRRNVFAAGNDDVAQSAPGAARISPATNARATWCSRNCPRPPPARCRNSSCARWRRKCEGFSRGQRRFPGHGARRRPANPCLP